MPLPRRLPGAVPPGTADRGPLEHPDIGALTGQVAPPSSPTGPMIRSEDDGPRCS